MFPKILNSGFVFVGFQGGDGEGPSQHLELHIPYFLHWVESTQMFLLLFSVSFADLKNILAPFQVFGLFLLRSTTSLGVSFPLWDMKGWLSQVIRTLGPGLGYQWGHALKKQGETHRCTQVSTHTPHSISYTCPTRGAWNNGTSVETSPLHTPTLVSNGILP